MEETYVKDSAVRKPRTNKKITWAVLKEQRQLIYMSVPLMAYIILFAYVPIWGWTMAFQDYKPAKDFSEQKWVGFKHFEFLFKDDNFLQVLRNTLAMSVINMILGFATAIILALLLNEIRKVFWKRTVQTISYLPHFLSWIIVTGIVATSLASDGIINDVLMKLHLIKEPIQWLSEGKYFWGIVGASHVWKKSAGIRLYIWLRWHPSTRRSMRLPIWTGQAAIGKCSMSLCRALSQRLSF